MRLEYFFLAALFLVLIFPFIASYIIPTLSILEKLKSIYVSFLTSYKITYTANDVSNTVKKNSFPDWFSNELLNYPLEKNSNYSSKLFLLKFRDPLSTYDAELKLKRLGFKPANLIELSIFLTTYGEKIAEFTPIILLNSFHNFSKSFDQIYQNYKRPTIGLCLSVTFIGRQIHIERPGEIEANENRGLNFSSHIYFLVKEP